MYSLLFVSVVSFVLSLLLTPLVRDISLRLGVVDHPDQDRKLHSRPIPRVGGIAIAASYICSYLVLLYAPLSGATLVRGGLSQVWDLMPAAAVVFVVGLLDDIMGLRPWEKLIGQMIAAGLAISAGVTVHGVVGYDLSPWLAVPATLLWLLACTNAFNLIDGVDGLAAGVGLFATITTLIAALQNHAFGLALAIVPLAGALAGFLRFNFNPATIFLGDSGSLTVGFLLGCYGILWSQKSATLLGMTAPLMALSIPLLDTALAIVRRFLRRQPIFGADRGHIHHRLLDRGLTPRKVALVFYAVGGVAAGLSLLQDSAHQSFGGLIIVLFCLMAWIGVQHLGYVEFGVAGRMFMEGAFRRHLNANIAVQQFQKALSEAKDWESSWSLLTSTAPEFGCSYMRVSAANFNAAVEFPTVSKDGAFYRVEIPLSTSSPEPEYVELRLTFDTDNHSASAAPFLRCIKDVLGDRRLPVRLIGEGVVTGCTTRAAAGTT